jgi:hypothetical protein
MSDFATERIGLGNIWPSDFARSARGYRIVCRSRKSRSGRDKLKRQLQPLTGSPLLRCLAERSAAVHLGYIRCIPVRYEGYDHSYQCEHTTDSVNHLPTAQAGATSIPTVRIIALIRSPSGVAFGVHVAGPLAVVVDGGALVFGVAGIPLPPAPPTPFASICARAARIACCSMVHMTALIQENSSPTAWSYRKSQLPCGVIAWKLTMTAGSSSTDG